MVEEQKMCKDCWWCEVFPFSNIGNCTKHGKPAYIYSMVCKDYDDTEPF